MNGAEVGCADCCAGNVPNCEEGWAGGCCAGGAANGAAPVGCIGANPAVVCCWCACDACGKAEGWVCCWAVNWKPPCTEGWVPVC